MGVIEQLGTASDSVASIPSTALNSVAFTGEQIQSALVVLRCLPREEQFDVAAQAVAIQDYVAATGLPFSHAALALHARITALNEWVATHDPMHQSNVVLLMDTAATCPLSETGKGLGFEPERFCETMALVADLPW